MPKGIKKEWCFKNEEDQTINYKALEEDYLRVDEDTDDEKLKIIEAVKNGLTDVETKIFLTYCELGSYVSVAKEYLVSTATAKAYIQRVREKIKDYISNN